MGRLADCIILHEARHDTIAMEKRGSWILVMGDSTEEELAQALYAEFAGTSLAQSGRDTTWATLNDDSNYSMMFLPVIDQIGVKTILNLFRGEVQQLVTTYGEPSFVVLSYGVHDLVSKEGKEWNRFKEFDIRLPHLFQSIDGTFRNSTPIVWRSIVYAAKDSVCDVLSPQRLRTMDRILFRQLQERRGQGLSSNHRLLDVWRMSSACACGYGGHTGTRFESTEHPHYQGWMPRMFAQLIFNAACGT